MTTQRFPALAFGALLLASLAMASNASAEEAEKQAAEALFRQAKALMDAGNYEPACEKFAASHAIEPGLGTLLYLGDCYERAGRFASAFATFTAAAQLAGSREDEPRQHTASVRAAALEPRAPKLEIQSGNEAPPSDLQITVNGSPFDAAELDRALPRDAGRYELRFSAPGYETFVSQVELKNGGGGDAVVTVPRLVRVILRAPLASEAAAVGVERDPGQGQRLAGWIVGAGGLGFGVAAGVLGVLAAGKNDDSKAACDPSNPNRCGTEGVRLRDDAQSLATLATIAGIVGGVGVTGGLVLYLSAPSSDSLMPSGAVVALGGAL